jgi:hypothetical protein
MINRRRFVSALSHTAVIASVSSAPLTLAMQIMPRPAQDAAALPNLSQALDRKAFVALQGQRFQLWDETGVVVEAELSAIRDERCCASLEQFSAVFRVPRDAELAEAIYTLAHRWAGECALLLNPSGEDGRGRYLTATFSLLRPDIV